MEAVAEGAPALAGESLRRAERALALLATRAKGFDVAQARARFEAGLSAAA